MSRRPPGTAFAGWGVSSLVGACKPVNQAINRLGAGNSASVRSRKASSRSASRRTCFDDARNWHEIGTCESLEAIARLRHKLVRVHPIANGNGRWARIMAEAYLATIDPDLFLDWSGGGSLTAESDHRARYIAALRSADGLEFGPLVGLVRRMAA